MDWFYGPTDAITACTAGEMYIPVRNAYLFEAVFARSHDASLAFWSTSNDTACFPLPPTDYTPQRSSTGSVSQRPDWALGIKGTQPFSIEVSPEG